MINVATSDSSFVKIESLEGDCYQYSEANISSSTSFTSFMTDSSNETGSAKINGLVVTPDTRYSIDTPIVTDLCINEEIYRHAAMSNQYNQYTQSSYGTEVQNNVLHHPMGNTIYRDEECNQVQTRIYPLLGNQAFQTDQAPALESSRDTYHFNTLGIMGSHERIEYQNIAQPLLMPFSLHGAISQNTIPRSSTAYIITNNGESSWVNNSGVSSPEFINYTYLFPYTSTYNHQHALRTQAFTYNCDQAVIDPSTMGAITPDYTVTELYDYMGRNPWSSPLINNSHGLVDLSRSPSISLIAQPSNSIDNTSSPLFVDSGSVSERFEKTASVEPAFVLTLLRPGTHSVVKSPKNPSECSSPQSSGSSEPYCRLLYRALLENPTGLTLQEIYGWIENNTTKASSGGAGWKNTIRHNLSLNEAFQKAIRAVAGKRKGISVWVLDETAIREGVLSTTKFRSERLGLRKIMRSNQRKAKKSVKKALARQAQESEV